MALLSLYRRRWNNLTLERRFFFKNNYALYLHHNTWYLSDIELFNGLKSGKEEIIEKIYDNIFPVVKSYIKNNSGEESDAFDVFQESLEIILLKIDNLEMKFENLIVLISKRRWLDRLRKSKVKKKHAAGLKTQAEDDSNIEKTLIEKEQAYLRSKILDETFERLSETCQKLMVLLKQGKSISTIVDMMSFTSSNTVYRRKAACMDRWSTLVKAHKNYSTYFE